MTKTSTILRTSVLAMIATGFFAIATPGYAADDDQVPHGEINVAGIDFASAKAVNHLITRLHRVALDICAPDASNRSAMTYDERKCVDAAVKTGMLQIDNKRQEALRASSVHVATAQPAATSGH